MRRPPFPLVLFAMIVACGSGSDAHGAPLARSAPGVLAAFDTQRPDEPPLLVTTTLPFHYPAALYARKVQGNVTLRLFVDRDGRVVHDSTRVEEPSGFVALDSAALAGAHDLHFVPAKLRGAPMPLSILFPVYFRHPEARPLPGDTILNTGKTG
jgi:TonB family protein